MKRFATLAALGATLAAGFVILILRYTGSSAVHGTGWTAIGILLVVAGATAAIVLVIAHAYSVEDADAHPSATAEVLTAHARLRKHRPDGPRSTTERAVTEQPPTGPSAPDQPTSTPTSADDDRR